MVEPRVKLLYIVGTGRSGSTIIERILGSTPAFVSLGEFRSVWDRNLQENRLCGCGQPTRDCPFWNNVFNRAFGGMDQADVQGMIAARDRATHTRALLQAMAGFGLKKGADIDKWLDAHVALYRSIREESGADVLIDSSKYPLFGFLLATRPELDVRLLHVVRDPRAVAYSWQRKKRQPDIAGDVYMPIYGPVATGWNWLLWNGAALALSKRWKIPRFELKYEAFAEAPDKELYEVLAWMGLEEIALPFTGPGTAKIGEDHMVSGNPGRFHRGEEEIRSDDAWMRSSSPRDVRWSLLFALPMMRHFGYSPFIKIERDAS